ncbi:MAG: hypothetical protein DWH78_11285 [Planctomycetota bacterium]|nr:MAG: hypothetical protein DWH78_11285 [Planctomycetota bacterium]
MADNVWTDLDVSHQAAGQLRRHHKRSMNFSCLRSPDKTVAELERVQKPHPNSYESGYMQEFCQAFQICLVFNISQAVVSAICLP